MQMSFRATVEPIKIGTPWTMVRIPFDPAEVWPASVKMRAKMRVKGSLQAAVAGAPAVPVPIRASLLTSKDRGCLLLVTAKMRKAANVALGSQVEIVLEPDLDELGATPPPELARLLKTDRALKKWLGTLNYSTRKYIATMVAEPKSAEARVRRAEQWMERLMLTMEGEQSPPPILQIAFRRQPRARAGWDALTANRRRTHLLELFGAQSPEAQARRVERIVAEALKKAGVGGAESARRYPERYDES